MIHFSHDPGLDADAFLGSEGFLSNFFDGYESRPQQLVMARAVQKVLRQGEILTVEAGTGVGKSFAYLSGAVDRALLKTGRVVISTHTIHLQQQLIEKDIPMIYQAVGRPFIAKLAKGRNNYICLRRLDYARKRQQTLFEDSGAELAQILVWSAETDDGSLSDLGFVPSIQTWQTVQSEHGACMGRKCSTFRECFYWRARRDLESADIIVANHALLFSDLTLKAAGAGVLPEYKYIICDEAHNLEHVAEDHFGIYLSQAGANSMLNLLFHSRRRKGLLAFLDGAQTARGLVRKCREAMRIFFAQVQAWYTHAAEETGGRCNPEFVDDQVTAVLRELRLEMLKLVKKDSESDDNYELQRMIERCREIETNLKDFLIQAQKDNVYWVEVETKGRRRVVLRSAPLHVGPYVQEYLLSVFESIVFTSATLSVGADDSKAGFSFFAERIGLEEFEALQVDSPFDYASQVRMHIEKDLPDPNDPNFTSQAITAIRKYLLKTEGRAFVLFTSYKMLRQISEQMRDWLEAQEMDLLVQGEKLDRADMLRHFKAHRRCVLFGTDSFWQGVDVPGSQLSNVIIVRLPFAVPSHPLIQGRIEKMRAEGMNPFFEYQLPMAVLKFKQGVGRLIRRKTDRGIVVVLDSRIVKKSYGRLFLGALPDCPVIFED